MDKFIELPSKIVGVTVYRNGARVTRACALVRDEAGFPSAVLVSDLPLALEDDSVRVRVETDESGAPPIARRFRSVLDTVKGAAESQESLRNALLQQDIEVKQCEKHIETLMGFRKALFSSGMKERPEGKRGEPPIESPLECRLRWTEFRRKRLCDLDLDIERQKDRRRELSEKRDALSAKLNESSSAERPRATELRKAIAITLDVTAADAKESTLFVEYLVPGARWAPCYDVSMKKGGDLRLSLRATVAQRSGEDWTGVALSLSTALPKRFSALPELKALKVGKRQAVRKRGPRKVESVEALYADYDAALSKIPRQSAFQDATATTGASQIPDAEPIPRPAPPPPQAGGMIPPPSFAMPVAAAPAAPPAEATMLRAASFAMPKRAASFAKRRAPSNLTDASSEMESSLRNERSSGMFGSAAVAEEEAELVPEAALLDFGSLRMGAPDSKSRGKIQPLSASERSRELLMFQSVEVHINILQLMQAAQADAAEVTCAELPTQEVRAKSEIAFDCIYESDHLVDIPSDGQSHTVMLQGANAHFELRYVAVPREEMQVFRLLCFTNPFPFPLLKGRVDVSAEGKMLPSGEIFATPASGKAELRLGAEQRIKISRNTDFKEEAAGLLRGQTSFVHTIDIKLVNHLSETAEVEVRERIPVTREKEENIKTAVRKVEPSWEPFEQRELPPSGSPLKGGYAWTVLLDPGEEKRLFVEYAVTVPAKEQLVGGNRREA